MPHRILKAHLFLQLQELEHIAAGAAAEAVKKSLVAIDVKGRRFLAVKRAEAFVRRAAFFQRHVLLNDLHDVGVHAKVVYE